MFVKILNHMGREKEERILVFCPGSSEEDFGMERS